MKSQLEARDYSRDLVNQQWFRACVVVLVACWAIVIVTPVVWLDQHMQRARPRGDVIVEGWVEINGKTIPPGRYDASELRRFTNDE